MSQVILIINRMRLFPLYIGQYDLITNKKKKTENYL